MPILKTIMLKWASSGTDMERPWRPRVEARLPGAPLPRPRVPWGPLPGPSGELSDSEPPSGHSLALWRSSSSLVAGLWVIVGPRGDGGQQHHRQLSKARVTLTVESLGGHQFHSVDRHRGSLFPLPWEVRETRHALSPLHRQACTTSAAFLAPFSSLSLALLAAPIPLRSTLWLTQCVPEITESPRELVAHFVKLQKNKKKKMKLKLAKDRQVDQSTPASCPPGQSLAPSPQGGGD